MIRFHLFKKYLNRIPIRTILVKLKIDSKIHYKKNLSEKKSSEKKFFF